MKPDKRIVTKAAQNQMHSSIIMLKTLVEVCEDTIWYELFYGTAFWYHVYHVAYFIDFWLRDKYDGSEFRSMVFDERIPPEFEHPVSGELSISREDMLDYLGRLFTKADRFFDRLDDELLAVPVIDGQPFYTHADVIMSQLRHIMYNIGYLNGILRSRGNPESDWYAYNETDQ